MCHHIFMYDGRDKNTSSQTNGSTKHILKIHMEVHKMKSIVTK